MNHNGFIAGEGFPFIIPLAVATLLAFLAGFKGVSLVLLGVTLFVVWFFRNPQRNTPEKDGLVISPADGRVIRIEETTSDEQPGRTFQKISIFMNVFNVHVNRIPCSGEVRFVRYREGKFLSANLDKASKLNERNTVLLQTADGKEIMTVQIAGLIARRIVCWLKEGMQVTRGERFGLIRFGSRVEVFLPLCSTILVRVGEKVRAGETPIGEL
ncbi:MAG: phosphatidylserine decarboxylase family protein, partial [Deltaproteobacteria bacterium]|nr:phosphatidylserine decarboxylase family protein [Deltaproteobacteria bacterium]